MCVPSPPLNHQPGDPVGLHPCTVADEAPKPPARVTLLPLMASGVLPCCRVEVGPDWTLQDPTRGVELKAAGPVRPAAVRLVLHPALSQAAPFQGTVGQPDRCRASSAAVGRAPGSAFASYQASGAEGMLQQQRSRPVSSNPDSQQQDNAFEAQRVSSGALQMLGVARAQGMREDVLRRALQRLCHLGIL